MKVSATGKIPVHIALSEVYAEEGLELFSAGDIKRQIEDCYQKYIPAQNRPFTSEDKDRIENEIEMSWDIHDDKEFWQEIDQELYEMDDEAIIRAYLNGSDTSDTHVVEMSSIATIPARALRRKQNAKQNKRLLKNVIIYYKGEVRRFNIDSYFKAVINGRVITSPKSRSLRYKNLRKLAEKKKLVTFEAHRAFAS